MNLLLVPEPFSMQLIFSGLDKQFVVSLHLSSEFPIVLLYVLFCPNEFAHHLIDKLHPFVDLILDQIDLFLNEGHKLFS